MPTKFDEFTPAARLHYEGDDAVDVRNLKILQRAMKPGRFLWDAQRMVALRRLRLEKICADSRGKRIGALNLNR